MSRRGAMSKNLNPRQLAARAVPVQVHEGFCCGDSRFSSAKGGDDFMVLTPNAFAILAAMSEQGGLLLFSHRRNIHVDVRGESLSLAAAVHFEKIELTTPSQSHVSADGQIAGDLMIHVGVNWPVGENDVRLFRGKEFRQLLDPRASHFRRTVNLSRKNRFRA